MTQFVGSSAQLRVYLCGRFGIERGKETVRLPTRKVKLLLAYLILHPEAHSREKLAALLWPDVPNASARASLRNALSILRRKIDRSLLLADRETVMLNDDFSLWVDVLAFQTQARRFLDAPAPDPDAVDLDLYRGDLLADFYADWVLVEREDWRSLYLETLLELTQQMRSHSDYERAIVFAEQVLAEDGGNERAHQHLMFCHVALGNRGAALRQYEACHDALSEELAVEPSPATKKLYEWIKKSPAEKTPVEASITNLPIPLTSFVGRRQEMGAIKDLLLDGRLITLTGVGGSGKTRLAVQVAMDLLDSYEDGVWWVELAALTDDALVPRTVAKALGVSEAPNQTMSETLTNFLRARKLLLVLDNCEHLVLACARLVERLLSNCPHLSVLATSRATLGVAGERVWSVPSLSVPAPQQLPPEQLLQYEAVRLFVDRATVVRPDFTLTEQNAPAVADICRRLEGIPLAIELAARRANVLTARQMADRLDDAFDLLAGGHRTALPRHQTLRAAIDWSYELLSDEERVLFRRLSVFAGGWTLQAAEAVCAGEVLEEDEVFDVLSRLVEKSLVEMQPRAGEARFRMLQTIREYGRERLLELGEYGRAHDRHLNYFLRLAEAADPHLGYFLADGDAAVWLDRLEGENDNLRAALRWSLEKGNGSQGSVEAGLRLAGNLHWFWSARGHFSEGRAWLAQLLESGDEASLTTRAQALLTAGYLACWQGDFTSGHSSLERALAHYQRLEDSLGISFSLHGLGFVALGEGKASLSRSLFEESLREAREADDRWLMSIGLHFLAIVLTYQGKYAQAIPCFEEGDTILQEMGGYKQGVAFSLFHMARIARLQGDYDSARSRHAEGLRLFEQAGDRRGIGYALAGFAVLATEQGNMQRAARLAGAVASLQVVLGSFLEAPLQIEYDRKLLAVREALDEEAFTAAWAEGEAMALERAVAYAVEAERG